MILSMGLRLEGIAVGLGDGGGLAGREETNGRVAGGSGLGSRGIGASMGAADWG